MVSLLTNLERFMMYTIHPETNSIYPPMDSKLYDRLPQVFKWIIEADHQNPLLSKVTDLKKYQEWKERRAQLRQGALNVIKKQRGSGGSGASG